LIQYNSEHITILTQAIIVVCFAFVVHIIKSIIFKKTIKRLEGKKEFLNVRAFFTSANTPITLLIYLFAFIIIINIVKKHNLDIYLLTIVPTIAQLYALLIVVLFVLKFIPKVEKNYHTRNRKKFVKLDKTATSALVQLSRVGVIIVAIIIALQTLGYSLTGLLAIGGAGGIIVGLAAKDTIANLFGGLMLHIERPFAIGDSIISNDHKSIMGTVEHIGLRSTRLLTLEKRPMYVPNSLFMTITLENTTRMNNRRIKELIGLRYDDIDKLPAVCKDIKNIIENHDGIDQEMLKLVHVNEFAASSINILVFAFTNSGKFADFTAIKEDILMQITQVVKKHGADFAFPTVTNLIPNKVIVEHLNG